MADMCLITLIDTHLKVYRVAHHIDFCRVYTIEEVAIVPVEVAYCIFVFLQAFVELFLVIHITFLHAQHTVKIVGGCHHIACPCDIADIVFLTLVYLQIEVYMLLVVVPHAVHIDGHVAISQFVVFVYEVLLGFLVALVGKLL